MKLKGEHVSIVADYRPRDWQAEAHFGLRYAKSGVLICSRQIGKSVASIAELITRALHSPPNTASAYICPAQTQARRIAWPELKRQIAAGLQYATVSETQLKITLPGDRVIYCLGAESGDNLRGLSLMNIICDERDSISDEFWRQVMLPTVNEYKDEAFICYVGTLAGGDSTLWRLYLDHRDDPDWFCMVVSAKDSGVFPQEWLDHQRKLMGESAYLREMECDPSAPVENAVLGEEVAEAEREGRVMPIPYRPGAEVITSWDLGIRDFTSVWAYMIYGRNIEVLWYREFSGLGIVDIIGRLTSDYGRFRWGEAILPHDAKAREKVSGFSVMDAFWERWPGHVHVFPSAPNPIATLQAARINLPRCLFNTQGCEQGLLRLKSASYVVDQKTGTVTDRLKHDDNSHAIDAFRYGMWRIESQYSSMGDTHMGRSTATRKPSVVGSLG